MTSSSEGEQWVAAFRRAAREEESSRPEQSTVSLKAAARRLRCTLAQLARMVGSGVLVPVKVGTPPVKRIPLAELWRLTRRPSSSAAAGGT